MSIIYKLFNFISKHKGSLGKFVLLIFVFSVLKGIAFLSPLGVNEVLDSSFLFGQFEYSLNVGQIVSGIISMGLTSAYAFFVVKNKQTSMIPIIHFHFFLLTCFLIICVIFVPTLIGNIFFGALILAVAFADQLMMSSTLKLSGKNNIAVTIDTGVYIVMGVVVLLVYLKIIPFKNEIWFGSILFTLVLTSAFYHYKKLDGIKNVQFSSLKELYLYGGLIVISSPFIVLITSSTRLYIGYLNDYNEVGLYSFIFRISSFILIFSRIIGIMLYRKFFIEEHKNLDKYFSLTLGFLFFVNILFYLLLPELVSDKYSNKINENLDLLLICLFQIIFWISVSYFEPILQRENKIKEFIVLLISCVLFMFTILFIMFQIKLNSLINIVFVNSFIIYLLFWGQQFILYKCNIVYPLTVTVLITIGILFFTSYLLI